ncbi:hypothetical protein M5C99_19690 [Acidovorax sp. NCPPB 2350]|nr:hypothetical protein M5C99_19690 [Acidovorax sp. NCPPB 2350]
MLPDLSPPRTASCPPPAKARAWTAACLALWCVLALGGCAAPPAEPPPPPPAMEEPPATPPESEAEKPGADMAAAPTPNAESSQAPTRASVSVARQMLQYADRVRGMAPPEITAEIAQLSDAQSTAPEKTFQLALALLQTRQPADTARALGLVQKVLGDNRPQAASLHPLARLLESRLLQQRRLEEQADRQAQQLKDGQRRIDQLNERLEAMRAIERSLNARPGAPGNGKAPPSAPPDTSR